MSSQNRFLAQIALMKKREGRYPSRDDPQRQQLLQGQHQSVNRILGRWNGEVSVAAARIDQVRRALESGNFGFLENGKNDLTCGDYDINRGVNCPKVRNEWNNSCQ